MATAEQNVCNLLRDTWMSLVTLIENLADIPKRVLDQIRQLLQKLKNIILNSLVDHAKEIMDMIKSYLKLRNIDGTKARQSFCSLLYACTPAINKLVEYNILPKSLSDAIFGSSLVSEDTLKTFGFQNVQFNSNFELFEYLACRLSMTSLLNSFIDRLINSLIEYLSQFEKYFDLDFWLNNHYIGRLIKRKIAEYEALMSEILRIINEDLQPFMDCAFATCDFAVSTKNFMEAFGLKHPIESIPVAGNTKAESWKVSKDKIFSEFNSSLENTKQIFMQIKHNSDDVQENYSKAKTKITKTNTNNELVSDAVTPKAYSAKKKTDQYHREIIFISTTTSEIA